MQSLCCQPTPFSSGKRQSTNYKEKCNHRYSFRPLIVAAYEVMGGEAISTLLSSSPRVRVRQVSNHRDPLVASSCLVSLGLGGSRHPIFCFGTCPPPLAPPCLSPPAAGPGKSPRGHGIISVVALKDPKEGVWRSGVAGRAMDHGSVDRGSVDHGSLLQAPASATVMTPWFAGEAGEGWPRYPGVP